MGKMHSARTIAATGAETVTPETQLAAVRTEFRARILAEALMGMAEMARMELAAPNGRLRGSVAWTDALALADAALAGPQ